MLRGITRAALLGSIALLLVGSYAAAVAYAEGGPYYHHRAVGEKGNGVKISETSPEPFEGQGGEQVLSSKVAGTPIEIVSKEVKISGVIYNNVNQAQSKTQLTYAPFELRKPEAKQCKVKMGAAEKVTFLGWIDWSWNGQVKQLSVKPQEKEQKIDDISFSKELKFTKAQEEGDELPPPEEEFTTVHIEKSSGESCILEGTYKINGASILAATKPTKLGEWSQTYIIQWTSGGDQHHWFFFVRKFDGMHVSLTMAGAPAEYKGELEEKTPKQEVELSEE